MSALRTFASALCIALGALLIATWAASMAALDALENGTVIEDTTARAITTDVARETLVDQGTTAVLDALEDAGFNTDIPGVEGITSGIIDAVVTSDAFITLVHTQTASVRTQVVDALNSPGEGPVVVTLDFSDEVNARLGQIPIIGDSLPTIVVPGLPVQVMDEQTADTVRTTWHWLQIAKTWFGWAGLALIGLGILVSRRKRWFFAKVATAVAVISAVVWLVMVRLEPQAIANLLPGAGVADAIVIDLVYQAKNSIATTMGWVALGAMIVALVLFTLAARGGHGGKK
ncbi:LPXTG cell wall anchor domain-containing protein [Demequina sp.]|uniref:LPXTG cell wall anchor domain-containing protein n=1 Tax=Demequina sp. TaxID=2050685 RepID=UPI003D105E9D